MNTNDINSKGTVDGINIIFYEVTLYGMASKICKYKFKKKTRYVYWEKLNVNDVNWEGCVIIYFYVPRSKQSSFIISLSRGWFFMSHSFPHFFLPTQPPSPLFRSFTETEWLSSRSIRIYILKALRAQMRVPNCQPQNETDACKASRRILSSCSSSLHESLPLLDNFEIQTKIKRHSLNFQLTEYRILTADGGLVVFQSPVQTLPISDVSMHKYFDNQF